MKYNKSGSLYRFLHNFIFSESLLHGGSYGAGIVAGNQSIPAAPSGAVCSGTDHQRRKAVKQTKIELEEKK